MKVNRDGNGINNISNFCHWCQLKDVVGLGGSSLTIQRQATSGKSRVYYV